MAYNAPFQPKGKTISFTTSGTPSTAQSRQVQASDFGLNNRLPDNLRVVNRGSADVWISFTEATATIAIPTPGTTTTGTPQQAICIVPGVVEVFTLPAGPVLWVNDISTGASETYHILGGEGS